MAADDLTGPSVLKSQRRTGRAGSVPEATPSSAGLPRNIGQSAPRASVSPAPRATATAPQVAAPMARMKPAQTGRFGCACQQNIKKVRGPKGFKNGDAAKP